MSGNHEQRIQRAIRQNTMAIHLRHLGYNMAEVQRHVSSRPIGFETFYHQVITGQDPMGRNIPHRSAPFKVDNPGHHQKSKGHKPRHPNARRRKKG